MVHRAPAWEVRPSTRQLQSAVTAQLEREAETPIRENMRSLLHPRDESQRPTRSHMRHFKLVNRNASSRLKGSSNIAKHLVSKLLPCEHVCRDDNANSSVGEQQGTLLSTGCDHCWSDLIYVIFFQRLKWRRLT